MKTGWHKYLFYCSVVFLVIALYKADYLQIPRIHSPAYLIFAFVCLFSGFVVNTLSQKRLLEKYDFQISVREALAMEGLNIFSKYIPGKVWMVMGKVVYLAERKKFRTSELSLLFLHVHIVVLFCGLVLGIFGLWMNDALYFLSWAGLAMLLLFTMMLLSKKVYQAVLSLSNKLLKRDDCLPDIDISKTLFLIPWFLVGWVLWGCGFYLLALSITDHLLPVATIFCFPLSATIGVLFLFAPGGIGIREGIITGYLVLMNVALPEAVTISAASRLWFLAGEILFFITGYIANRKDSSSNCCPGS